MPHCKISRFTGDRGPEIVSVLTGPENSLEEFQRELQSDTEVAIDYISDETPEMHQPGMDVIDALIGLDTGEGTACNALEWWTGQIYERGMAKGREELLARLRTMPESRWRAVILGDQD